MKRSVILCLALACLAALAASATGTGEQPASAGSGPMKLTMAVSQQFAVPSDSKYVQIMGKKYNIQFNIWPCYGDEYENQVNLRLSAGEIPDLMQLGQLDAVELVKQKIITEVNPKDVQQHMPKWWKEIYTYSTSPFKYCKIDGKVYGLPGQSADGIYHFVVLWRSDWLKKLGIAKVPETLVEAEKALYAYAKNDPDGNGKNDTYGLSNLGMLPIFGAFGPIPYTNNGGAEMYSEKSGKIVHNATEPSMKEALRLFAKWYKDGVLDPEFVTGERTGGHWSATQAFSSGRIGFSSPGQYYHSGSKDDLDRNDGRVYKMFYDTQKAMGNMDAAYVHGKPPLGYDGKTAGTLKWGVEEGMGYTFGVTLEKDHPKFLRIMDWLDDTWMVFDNYMSAIYGTKGEDWTYDTASGKLSAGLGPDTKEAQEKDTYPQIGLGFFFVNDIVSMMRKETPKFYQFADKVANFTVGYADPVGAAPLVSLSKYKADLLKLTLVAYTDMITGKKPVDTYFDQYVKDWMSAGGAKVLEEATEWYKVNAKK
jgi:putative aldouronate transport system substrate-binding protein